jgi:4-hydroxy-2-oxoheptanedioate aldolase
MSIGGWCHFSGSYTAELMGAAGFDWCCIDMQHGLADRAAVVPMLQALASVGCEGLVRVPGPDHADIAHALDGGAKGVIIPQVSSAEQAQAAVASCKYPPVGHRSWGPLRAKLTQKVTPLGLNEQAQCFVMIEDQAGLDSLDAIVAVQGVSGIFVGPADLALSLWGDPSLANASRTIEAAAPVAAACRTAGITAGAFAGGAQYIDVWSSAGFTMLATDSDSNLLLAAARKCAADARQTLDTPSTTNTGSI